MESIDWSDIDRRMGIYTNAKQAKIVTQQELDEKRDRSEWSHQLRLCKWLKHTYPEVRFRSDIQSAGKLSGNMQNIKDIIDPFRGWPDLQIYLKRGVYCGLQIELKREKSGLWLKDKTLSKDKHVQEQAEMHEYLRSLGWAVCFAEGEDEAKRFIVKYVELK